MLGLFLNAAVLCAIVWVVARGTAEIDFWVMFMISLGVSVAGFALAFIVGGGVLGILALLPIMALLAFLLMKFCYLSLQQALISTAIYFAYAIGMALLLMPVAA